MSAFQVLDQLHQPRLRFLVDHGFRFDGPDRGLRFRLRRFGQRVDVIEDVGGFGDVEGGSEDICFT